MRSILSNRPSLLVVTGPTASGKTRRAVSLARLMDGEIVSADSRQVYRHMDIGTGKDIEEYGDVPYHLIDVANPGEIYNLFRFLSDAREAISGIRQKDRLPVVCGGTGMYAEALIKGMNLPEVPENRPLRNSLRGKTLEELTDILSTMKRLHNTTDVDTAQRAIRAIEIAKYYETHPEEAAGAVNPVPEKDVVIIGVDVSREVRRQRISDRLRQRLANGMVAEVERLIADGADTDVLISYGLEYKFLTQHILGSLSYDDMVAQLEIAIHQFAKRQMTWFRGMERRGLHVNWVDGELDEDEFNSRVIEIIERRCGAV